VSRPAVLGFVPRLALPYPALPSPAAAAVGEGGGPPPRRARPVRRRLVSVRLVCEGPFAAPDGYPPVGVPVRSPRDVFAVMAPFAARECAESFWVLPLDSQHRLAARGPVVVTRGLLNASLVHPREVFRPALAANAAALILVHNHPSGDPAPSADDRAVTVQMVQAGHLLDVPVHDHVVIGRGRYTSFAEAGLL